MNFPNYTYTPNSGQIVGNYNINTHKVVPKDAVVLDLVKGLALTGSGGKSERWIRHVADLHEKRSNLTSPNVLLLRWIADQIEEQTKRPRPPEPGLWGRVTDQKGDTWVRAGANQHTSREWLRVDGLPERVDYRDIDVAEVWDKGRPAYRLEDW